MSSIISNGKILTGIYSVLNVSEEQEKSNINNAIDIFKKIPNGYNDFENNVGLVVGKVQSGKTANIIALSGLCFDNNHRLIIMLLGDTNNLLDQNFNRVKYAFSSSSNVKVYKKAHDGDFDSLDKDDLEYLYNKGNNILICSLKHYKHINELLEKINNTSYANNFSLIIDDESDDISQNTNKHKFNKENDRFIENERSATNLSIVNLKRALKHNSYVSVTATPQANILLQRFQELAPNFCSLIKPGIGYKGLLSFHSQDTSRVSIIDDFTKENFLDWIPGSLYNAMCYFVGTCIIRSKREENDFKNSMMIHPSKKIIDHKKVYNNITALFANIKYGVKYKNDTGYDFVSNINKQFNNEFQFTIDEVEDVVNSLKIHCINGENDANNLQEKMSIMPYHIIIGGDLLDRGITIEGLVVSYMTRESKVGQADTLLQRGRWFGYKSKYFDLCRVYLTQTLKLQYESLIEHDISVWDFLDYCSNIKYNMQDQNGNLYIDSTILKPTSTSKADYTSFYISSVMQQRLFTTNYKYNQSNLNLFADIENRDGEILKYNDTQVHKKIKIKYSEFKNILNKFKFAEQSSFERRDSFNLENIKAIFDKYSISDSDTIDLISMRIKTKECRSTVSSNECKILNLMQGYSEGKAKTDKDYYVGDRNIVNNNMMVQLHHVLLKNDVGQFYKKDDEVIMMSILLPNKFSKSCIIRRKNLTELEQKYC